MKVIAWNCKNGKFQSKKDAILELGPDILVVPECDKPENLMFENAVAPSGRDWIGDKNGIGVFCFNGYRLERLGGYDHEIKYFAPFRVSKDDFSVTILAAWAWKPGDSSEPYYDIVSKAIKHYDLLLHAQTPTLFLGDFNTPGTGNNLMTPVPNNPCLNKHREIVGKLAEMGMVSLFHAKNKGLVHGKEKPDQATLYYNKHRHEPFHCDYCFASKTMADRLLTIEIGDPNVWLDHSDHMPLIMTFGQ